MVRISDLLHFYGHIWVLINRLDPIDLRQDLRCHIDLVDFYPWRWNTRQAFRIVDLLALLPALRLLEVYTFIVVPMFVENGWYCFVSSTSRWHSTRWYWNLALQCPVVWTWLKLPCWKVLDGFLQKKHGLFHNMVLSTQETCWINDQVWDHHIFNRT